MLLHDDIKIAVIGLDGMSWKIFDKLIEYNSMPSLDDVVKHSLKGTLKSTIPPNSAAAWTSIASGVNPGKHGVFNFTEFDSSYNARILSSNDVKYPRIHEMLSLLGLKSVCVNLPFSYPINKIKGSTVITDWLSPKLSYYPNSVKKYATEYKTVFSDVRTSNKNDFYKNLYDVTSRHVNAVNNMIEELNWNFFFVVFSESDHIFHKYCDDLLDGEDLLLKIFNKIDETIKCAKKSSDLTIIISDHGFSKYEYAIYVNSILNKMGYLVRSDKLTSLNDVNDFTSKETSYNIKVPDAVYRYILKSGMRTYLKRVSKYLLRKNVQLKAPTFDPDKSRAFMPFNTSFGIHVKEEKEVKNIKNYLNQLSYIKGCWTRDEIYTGSYVKKAPEIMFLPNFDEGYTRGETTVPSDILLKRSNWWQHHPDGIVAFSSKEINQGLLGDFYTYDLVPSVLNYFRLPIPRDTDGTSIFNLPLNNFLVDSIDYYKMWMHAKQTL